MKVALSLKKTSLGKSFIMRVQNKRRKDPVMNNLRHIANRFEAKHPVAIQKIKQSSFFHDVCTLIGILPITRKLNTSKTSIGYTRHRGFRNLDFD